MKSNDSWGRVCLVQIIAGRVCDTLAPSDGIAGGLASGSAHRAAHLAPAGVKIFHYTPFSKMDPNTCTAKNLIVLKAFFLVTLFGVLFFFFLKKRFSFKDRGTGAHFELRDALEEEVSGIISEISLESLTFADAPHFRYVLIPATRDTSAVGSFSCVMCLEEFLEELIRWLSAAAAPRG